MMFRSQNNCGSNWLRSRQGLFKAERVITSPQDAHIGVGAAVGVESVRQQLPGAGQHPAWSTPPMKPRPLGLRSVFGALHLRHTGIHKQLEPRSAFLGTEDTILYPSCFDANGGLFETLLSERMR